jgi:hypothetical protein
VWGFDHCHAHTHFYHHFGSVSLPLVWISLFSYNFHIVFTAEYFYWPSLFTLQINIPSLQSYKKEPCTKDWLALGSKEAKGQSAKGNPTQTRDKEGGGHRTGTHGEHTSTPRLANHSTTRERAGRARRRPWSRDLRSTAP